MRAHFGLPSITSDEVNDTQWKVPIEVKFEIPYFTVSGLQVRYLKIIEKSGYQVVAYYIAIYCRPTHSLSLSSQALPWVRYITMNGNYQLRMA